MDYQFSNLERILEADPSNVEALIQYVRICFRTNKNKAEAKALNLISKSLRHDFYSEDLSDGKIKLELIRNLIPDLLETFIISKEFRDLSAWVDANILVGERIFEIEISSVETGDAISFQHGNLGEILNSVKEHDFSGIRKGSHDYWIGWNGPQPTVLTLDIYYVDIDPGIEMLSLRTRSQKAAPFPSLRLMGRHFELFDSSFQNNYEISEPFIKWVYDNFIE